MKNIVGVFILSMVSALMVACLSVKTEEATFLKNEYAPDSVHVKGVLKGLTGSDRTAVVGYLKDMCEYDKIFFEPDEQGI